MNTASSRTAGAMKMSAARLQPWRNLGVRDWAASGADSLAAVAVLIENLLVGK
jgi:hypothetical protein